MLTVDLDRLGIQPGMAVLDAGCGPGRHSIGLLRRRCLPVALDLEPPDLRQALGNLKCTRLDMDMAGEGAPPRESPLTQKPMGDALNVRLTPDSRPPFNTGPHPIPWLVLQGDTLRLPFGDGVFERIICSEVLEHLDDPATAAAELARVLKPGGMLAVSVPTPVSEWVYYHSSDDYFNTPGGHVRIFGAAGLARLLARQGLEVREVHFAHGLHSLYWWVRSVFGLHHETHWAIRRFKWGMDRALFSPAARKTEGWLNLIWPKAMVLYARKPKP